MSPITDAELPKDALDVELHRVLTDFERIRNLLIPITFREQSQNLEFTRRYTDAGRILGELGRRLWSDPTTA